MIKIIIVYVIELSIRVVERHREIPIAIHESTREAEANPLSTRQQFKQQHSQSVRSSFGAVNFKVHYVFGGFTTHF